MAISAARNGEGERDAPRTPPPVVSRTGPRRSESARLAVLRAADDLLVERGFDGVTVEGIAARAGVSKQTIYRWWKSKVDILLDTIADDAPEALAWEGGRGTPEEELKAQLRRVADFLASPPGQVLQALLGHAQLDERTARRLREGFVREQRERDLAGLRAVLARHAGAELDRETGSEVEAATAERLLDALLGPLYHQVLVQGQVPGPEFTDAVAEWVLELASR
ncbi:TetR/AcrR family transcriptional regulator [Wenjunlia tyrosinilytica]|uniref:Transcriptional regulator, TetR family protein n=1 Tax=Wenjunlia tyrosinilytica TaxID=1544741 RepID=A0A917ZEP6_9ACTN|nr:TetR/AcrR family transcriptional regulator [Wenjunlia tyrosinilytica]GGO80569.1 putative transcriptional regulator, TetR family protein [Wenjunlia tyrosinilytica]